MSTPPLKSYVSRTSGSSDSPSIELSISVAGDIDILCARTVHIGVKRWVVSEYDITHSSGSEAEAMEFLADIQNLSNRLLYIPHVLPPFSVDSTYFLAVRKPVKPTLTKLLIEKKEEAVKRFFRCDPNGKAYQLSKYYQLLLKSLVQSANYFQDKPVVPRYAEMDSIHIIEEADSTEDVSGSSRKGFSKLCTAPEEVKELKLKFTRLCRRVDPEKYSSCCWKDVASLVEMINDELQVKDLQEMHDFIPLLKKQNPDSCEILDDPIFWDIPKRMDYTLGVCERLGHLGEIGQIVASDPSTATAGGPFLKKLGDALGTDPCVRAFKQHFSQRKNNLVILACIIVGFNEAKDAMTRMNIITRFETCEQLFQEIEAAFPAFLKQLIKFDEEIQTLMAGCESHCNKM